MKRTNSFFVLAGLFALAHAPRAHADLLVDFLDGSTGTDSYVTDSDPFGNAIALRVQTGSATLTGGISGTGDVYKIGTGTLLMTGTYSHLGDTTIRGGKIEMTGQITQSDAFAVGHDNVGGELLLRSGGTINSALVFIAPFANSGTSIVTLDGSGTTWTVHAIPSPADPGSVRVGNLNDGTLVIQNGALMSSAVGYIGLAAGADGFATVTGTNSRWLNTAQMLVGNEGTGSLTISSGGRVENSYARIAENTDSTGTVLVTGVNATWASSGDLYVGNTGNGSLTISSGGTVTSVGSSRIGDKTGSTGTVSLSGAGSSWTNTGAIIVGNNGSGTLTLDGAAGSQSVLSTRQLRAGAGTALFNWNGGILRATETRTDFLLDFGVGEIDVQAGGAFIDSNGFDVGSNSVLSGVGGFAKSGAGTFTYTGSAFMFGTTSVNGGGLTIGAGGSYFTGGAGVGRDAGTTGTLRVTGAGATFDGGNFITVGDGIGSTGTLTVDGGGLVRMVAGAKLTVGWQNATGTLNLDAGGTIEVGGTDGLQKHATGTTTINFAGGTLRVVNSAFTTSLPIALTTGNSTINTNGFDATLSGGTSGAGRLIKSGAGILNLTATSSHSGGTQLDGGTLNAGVASAFGTGRKFIVNSGVLDLGGFAIELGELSGSGGTVFVGSGSLTVNQATDTTYSGSISGTTNFVKTGAGLFQLTGSAGAFLGTTSVNGGTLAVSSGGTFTTLGLGVGRVTGTTGTLQVIGAGSVLTASNFLTVGDEPSSNGTLTISSGGRVTLGNGAKLTVGWATATGTLNLNTGGTLEIGGADGLQMHPTGTSTINFAGGTFRVVNSDFTTSLPLTLAGAGSTFDTNGLNATFSGALTGTGSLVKTGIGTLTLSGSNNYSGGTIISAGSLALNGTVGAITLDGGSLAPGASPGTLNATNLDWLSGPVVFDLGTNAASSDLLILSGVLNGPGNLFNFSFANNGWLAGQTYELIRFGSTNITAAEFAFTNGNGFDGSFAYDGNSLKFSLVTVPEPGVAASLSFGLAALGFTRRRRLQV